MILAFLGPGVAARKIECECCFEWHENHVSRWVLLFYEAFGPCRLSIRLAGT